MKVTDRKIGFIGGGRMGEAIFSGLLRSGAFEPSDMAVSCRRDEKCAELAEKYPGIRTFNSSKEEGVRAIVEVSDIVFIATLPQQASYMLPAVARAADPSRHTVVSVMGGITLAQMENLMPGFAVVRAMPNTPVSVTAGVCGLCRGSLVSGPAMEEVKDIFGAIGLAVEGPEAQMDALTAISGCGPAFCAQFISGLADGGVAAGLPRELAIKVAAQTLAGTGRMVLETGQHPEILKDGVCSPGGSTIAGCIYLDERGLRGLAAGALKAARDRMAEVAREA